MFQGRRIGMEIEFDSNQIQHDPLFCKIDQEIRAKTRNSILRRMESPDQWTMKTDCSCGWELTTPALLCNEKSVREIVDVIRSISHLFPSKICSARCGIHVHVDGKPLDDISIKRFFKMWYYLEPAIWSIHEPGRPNAAYIAGLRSIYDNSFQIISRGHDNVVNVRGDYRTNPRYEIRYCQSTVNAEDVQFWLMTVVYLVTLGEQISDLMVPYVEGTTPIFLQEFIRQHKSKIDWIDSNRLGIINWMERRYQKFHGSNIVSHYLKN